jgi:hypothetical protein
MQTIEQKRAKHAAYMREFRKRYVMTAAQKERWKSQVKQWANDHPEKWSDYKKKYRSKPGVKEKERQYRLANIEKERVRRKQQPTYKGDRRKAQWIKTSYGLTWEQYQDLVKAAKGICEVCEQPFGKRGPFVDHCHTTGVVRGLLCSKCNLAEGYLKTPEAVLRLYHYMTKSSLFYQGDN